MDVSGAELRRLEEEEMEKESRKNWKGEKKENEEMKLTLAKTKITFYVLVSSLG